VETCDDRTAQPNTDGPGGDARPIPTVRVARPDAFVCGPAAREFRPMDLMQRLATPDRFPAVRRSRQQERVTMNSLQVYDLALQRCQEYQAEAERQRLVREYGVRRARYNRLVVLRRSLGAALVRAGERVQGAERTAANARPAAGDVASLAGHLKVVR
jgi:hypothetical protein